jgi:FAD/FMN-containing dehydrogenase
MDRPARDALWAYRERHTEAVNAAGVPQKLDVAVPQAEVVAFEAALRALVAAEPSARLVLWGHLSEGNFHVNLLGLEPDVERLADSVLRLVLAHHGSISSEHGLGVAKARWLELARGPADVSVMRRVKQSFYPGGIMNPGDIFPL